MGSLSLSLRSSEIAKQWERIKAIRDELLAFVVLDDGWEVDVDVTSILTMSRRVVQWGVGTSTMTPDGRQLWKGKNNDIRFFTQAEFSAFVADVELKQALRTDAVFGFAEGVRALLPIGDDHPAFDRANWPG